jgi:hypothetical protein
MGDIGLALQRAQDKTEQLQARAGALDELMASGALPDATVPGGRDDVQSQLDALTAGHDVDDELTRMKAQLPASAAPPAVEGPGTASADPQLRSVHLLRDPFPGSHRGPRLTKPARPRRTLLIRHHGPRELLAACIART